VRYQIAAVNFIREPVFEKLVVGFKKSVIANSNAELNIKNVLRGKDYTVYRTRRDNNLKLQYWVDFIRKATMPTVLMDTDTLVLQDIGGAFDMDFDVAITVLENDPISWFNGGVVFVKPSKKVADFFDLWLQTDNQLMANPGARQMYARGRKISGQNQVSFTYLYDDVKIKIIELPCHVWNCCNSAWDNFSENTKVLHIKEGLRKIVFRQKYRPEYPKLNEIAGIVRPYYDLSQ